MVKHPLRNQRFLLLPDGHVQVDDLDSGASGIFTRSGSPVSGTMRYADPHLLSWVAGRATATRPTNTA